MAADYNKDFKIPFRDFVLSDINVAGLIGDKFNGAQLATFYTNNTSFPLATFTPQMGGFPNLTIYEKFSILISGYSDKSYDEAHDVFHSIYSILGGDGPESITPHITVRPIGTTYESFDTLSRLYQVTGKFLIIWIP